MTLHNGKNNIHISENLKLQEYHKVVGRLVKKYTPSKGKVLDIGCGYGHTLSIVTGLEPSLELYAADISQECLDITRERVAGTHTILMDKEGFDNSVLGSGYDTCIMSHSLEHMLFPLDVLKRVLSIIKPGGHLVLAVPNPVRPYVILWNMLRKNYVNKGHVSSWDRPHWMNFLENIAKCNVVEYASDEVRLFPRRVFPDIRVFTSIELLVSRILPWLSTSNIAVVTNDGS